MGTVYLARQDPINRLVVLKASREMGAPTGTERAQADYPSRSEAETQAALVHPHILPLLDYRIEGDHAYLVSPYVPQGSLAQYVDLVASLGGQPYLPITLTIAIVAQVAAALQYAHERGIVHCDIKPGNILIHLMDVAHVPITGALPGLDTELGDWSHAPAPESTLALGQYPYVFVADFGLARAIFDRETSAAIGTPQYAAPELAAGLPLPATDQYALACVAFLLLTGHHVFEGDHGILIKQHRASVPPRASMVNGVVPSSASDVLARALAKEPAQRYPRIADFARALTLTLSLRTSQALLGGRPPYST